MKTLIILAGLVLAACDKGCVSPPRTTIDGKTCTWARETDGTQFTQGTCIKDGLVLTCMYTRDATPQVVCGSTLPLPAETPK